MKNVTLIHLHLGESSTPPPRRKRAPADQLAQPAQPYVSTGARLFGTPSSLGRGTAHQQLFGYGAPPPPRPSAMSIETPPILPKAPPPPPPPVPAMNIETLPGAPPPLPPRGFPASGGTSHPPLLGGPSPASLLTQSALLPQERTTKKAFGVSLLSSIKSAKNKVSKIAFSAGEKGINCMSQNIAL